MTSVARWAALALTFVMSGCSSPPEIEIPPRISYPTLIWSDEFEGPAGSPIDPNRWVHETGAWPFNGELQFYTAATENVGLDGQGNLTIVARRQAMGDRAFTSARVNTKGKLESAYGRFEARMRLPSGQGLWPAFWLLGADYDQVGWPRCGEIDIMEESGGRPATIAGSLHGPGYSGGNPIQARHTLPAGSFADGFHLFAIEWQPAVIRWFVDDQMFQIKTIDEVATRGLWAFDHPFFVVLNLAVGGVFPGDPDETTAFPQALTIDYVRVWKP